MDSYKISPRFSWKKLGTGCILLDLEKGSYFTLNDTASLIWDGVMRGLGEEAIAASVAAQYVISLEQARADVGGTIAQLVQEGVLERRQ